MYPALVIVAAIGQAQAYCNVRGNVATYRQAAPYKAYSQAVYTPIVKELQYVAVEQANGHDYEAAIVGDYIRRERKEAEAGREAEELRDELKEIRQALRELARAPRQPVEAAPPPYLPILPSPQAPAKAGPQGYGNVPPPPFVPGPSASAPADVLAILGRSCFECHNAAKPKGQFKLFDAPGILAALTPDDLAKIAEQVESGAMPEKGDALSNDQMSAVLAWAGAK